MKAKKTKLVRRMSIQAVEDLRLDPPHQVAKVVEKVKQNKIDRRRHEIRTKLSVINQKIKWILEDADISSNLEFSEEEIAEIQSSFNRAPGEEFNAKIMREKIEHQQYMLAVISQYLRCCEERQYTMEDLQDWFVAAKDLERGLLTIDDLKQKEKEYEQLHLAVKKTFDDHNETTLKLNKIGKKLLKLASGEDDYEEEEEGQTARKGYAQILKESRKVPKEIINEELLLSDPNNMAKALQDVKRSFDEPINNIRSQQMKIVLRNGARQFKFITKAVQKRQEMLEEKEKIILDKACENDRLNNVNNTLNKKLQDTQRKLDKLDNDIEIVRREKNECMKQNQQLALQLKETQRNLTEALEKQKEQEAVVIETKKEMAKEIQKEKIEFQRRMSMKPIEEIPKLKEHPSQTESVKSVEKVVSLDTLSKNPIVIALKDEVDKLKDDVQHKETQMQQMEMQLKKELAKVASLESKIKSSHEITNKKQNLQQKMQEDAGIQMKTLYKESESLQRQVELLKSDLECKEELIKFQEARLAEVKGQFKMMSLTEEAGKQGSAGKKTPKLIQKIKAEYEGEVNRLKDFVEKEKNRSEAAIRRMEAAHKETLLGIHRESIHLLRAINRFKETVAQILEKEQLPVAAHQVRLLANLPTEEVPSDVKMLLGQMAGNAVELLVAIEFKLSQALMNKRLEIKDNTMAKMFVTKDLNMSMEATAKARHNQEIVVEKLRQTKEQLMAAEEALKETRKNENERFSNLSYRYRKLWGQHKELQRDFHALQKELNDAAEKRDVLYRHLKQHKAEVGQTMAKQQAVIADMKMEMNKRKTLAEKKMRLSVDDQRQNLEMLEKGFKENKISKEMYQLTSEIVQKTMNIPLVRLRYLVERYVSYRKWKEARANLMQRMSSDVLPLDSAKRSEFHCFIKRMDDKILEMNQSWQEHTQELEGQRKNLFVRMEQLFKDVVRESGIFLVGPTTVQQEHLGLPDVHAPARRPKTQERLQTPSGRRVASHVFVDQNAVLIPLARTTPSVILGKGIPKPANKPETCWKILSEFEEMNEKTLVEIPKTLHLDVHSRIRAARRVLQKIQRRAYPTSHAESYDCKVNQVETIGDVLKEQENHRNCPSHASFQSFTNR